MVIKYDDSLIKLFIDCALTRAANVGLTKFETSGEYNQALKKISAELWATLLGREVANEQK